MQKFISIVRATSLSVILLSLITLSVTGSVSAANQSVRGKIKTSSNGNANGASVTVTCNSIDRSTTSASNGNFEVVFADGQCDQGASITVNASLNGESASVSQAAQPSNTNFGNIQLAPIAVPEFGMITGIMSAIGAGGAYLGMRKKFFA